MNFEIDLWYQFIFYIYAGFAAIQLVFYFFFYLRIYSRKKEQQTEVIPLSVIICARNESQNLQKYLPSILEQKHPDFEVIVVNDGSEDDTKTILEKFQEKYSNLYFTTIDREADYRNGKKLALTVGIKAAKNEWLVFTDADCIASSDEWLSKLQRNFLDKTKIILGYGGYFKRAGLLNRLIRYETVVIAVQYITYALAGVPYMGVGRNLAYRKSLFFENKGFAKQLNIISGSDDLFINRLATKLNTKTELDPKSFTLSEPSKKMRQWIRQKRRHFTTSKYYRFKHKLLLGTELFSRIFFYIIFFFLIIGNILPVLVGSIFAVRLLIYSIVYLKAYKHLKENGLYLIGLFFDFLLPFINFIIIFTKIFNRRISYKWK